MEKTYVYKTHNVCSRELKITYEDGTIKNLEVLGGCKGNLQGISALVKGMKLEEVVNRLDGIICRNGTSCPDNLAAACKEIIALEAK